MARFGVCRFVTRHHRIGEDAVEDLLAGQVPEGGEELAHLARFTADLRSFAVTSPNRVLSVMAAAGHTSDKGDLPATAASNAHGPARPGQGAGLPNWNRRPAMLKSFLSNAIGKAAGGVTAATMSVGAAGAAGALPSPVQRVVADAADTIGVDMPSPDDETSDPTTDPASGDVAPDDDSTDTHRADSDDNDGVDRVGRGGG